MTSPSKKRITHRLHGERGWTLIELLIGISMTLALIFAALPIIDGAAKTSGRTQDAATSIGTARAFSEEVLRDIRSAESASGSATTLNLSTWVRHSSCGATTLLAPTAAAIKCNVTYTCSGGAGSATCTRTEGSASAVTAIKGLASPSLFSYSQGTDQGWGYVGLSVKLPTKDPATGGAITLTDGSAVRNSGT
jgi:type II secretory pathway pseudopilin PulG